MATLAVEHDGFYVEGERPHVGILSRVYGAYHKPILGSIGIILLLAGWQWYGSSSSAHELFASFPTKIIATAQQLAATGELARDFLVSGKEFAIGFGLAILVGIPVGILMGWYEPVEELLDPLVNFLYATPRIALLPLLVIWLGIGVSSKVALVFMGAVFPVLINMLTGVKNLDESLIKLARSYGASDMQIFRTMALPGSVPYLLSGLRLGLGHALIGVVVGELTAATAGIGFLISVSGAAFRTDKVMVGVLIVAGMGVICTSALKRIENHFDSWRGSAPNHR